MISRCLGNLALLEKFVAQLQGDDGAVAQELPGGGIVERSNIGAGQTPVVLPLALGV
jgi:hypothetical protein